MSAKTFAAAAVAALTLAGASIATSSQAEARGGAFVAGLIGGAVVGAALTAPAYAYGPTYYVAPAPAPVYVPSCHKVFVTDAWGNVYKQKVCD